jgi:hypothetical protein
MGRVFISNREFGVVVENDERAGVHNTPRKDPNISTDIFHREGASVPSLALVEYDVVHLLSHFMAVRVTAITISQHSADGVHVRFLFHKAEFQQ